MSTDAVRMSQWPSDQRYVIPVAPGPDIKAGNWAAIESRARTAAGLPRQAT